MRPEDVSKEEYTNWLFEQARIDLGGRPAEIGMTTPRVTKGMKGVREPGEMEFLRPEFPGGGAGAPPRIGRSLLAIMRYLDRMGFYFANANDLLARIRQLEYFVGLDPDHPFRQLIDRLFEQASRSDTPISMIQLFEEILRMLQPGRFGAIGRYIFGGILGDNMDQFTRYLEGFRELFNINKAGNRALMTAMLELFSRRGPSSVSDADFVITILRRLGIGDLSDLERFIRRRITRRINNLPDGVGDVEEIVQGLSPIFERFLRELRSDLVITIKIRNPSGDLVEQTVDLIDYLGLLTQNGNIADIGALLTTLQSIITSNLDELYGDMSEYLIRVGLNEDDVAICVPSRLNVAVLSA